MSTAVDKLLNDKWKSENSDKPHWEEFLFGYWKKCFILYLEVMDKHWCL
jgi:hypothetical protein